MEKIVLGWQISHLRSLKLELITQPKRVLNKEVLQQGMLAGVVSVPLTVGCRCGFATCHPTRITTPEESGMTSFCAPEDSAS